jgi:hypothetical protein
MLEGDFSMSKKQGSNVVASAVAEMARLVRGAAAPSVPGEKVPHAIARAAHRLGFTRGRTESFWYGKVRKPSEDEIERAREVAARRSKDAELLRHDYQRALAILARLEAGLAAIDEDFHRPTLDALRDLSGPKVGPRDSGA